jgi:CubicO group peptidase (beta-lactamase class C family)
MIRARADGGILTIAVMACFVSGPAQSQPAANCGVPIADQDEWKIAPPQSVGFDPSRLCQWVEHRVTTPIENIHAVLVVRHGELVFERYFTGDDERFGRPLGQVAYDRTKPHDMRSISKTVTSLLLGIALEQKKVALHQSQQQRTAHV